MAETTTIEPDFDKILAGLDKKQDSKYLFKILTNIRKQVEWPKHKEQIASFRTKGYIKHVIRTLQMPQKHIIDVSLSILGNCVLDKGCARMAIGTYNILTSLGQLLERYPTENTINGRIFRILGNMCTHRDQWANTIVERKPEFVQHTVDLLNTVCEGEFSLENYSEATVTMAVRLLRLMRYSIMRVNSLGVLKVVGCLFAKLTSKWEETGAYANLLNNVIKILYEYTRFNTYHCISELKKSHEENPLMCLSKVVLLNPKCVVKIFLNCLEHSRLRSELPICEIFAMFNDKLLNYSKEELGVNYMIYIDCLCSLLDHPIPRSLEQWGSCVKTFVKVLETLKEPSRIELKCCNSIIRALTQCRYEERFVTEELECNIIPVLAGKLKWAMGVKDESESLAVSHKVDRKRGNPMMVRKLLGNREKPKRRFMNLERCNRSEFLDYTNIDSPIERMHTSQFPSPSSDDDCRPPWDRSPSPCSSNEGSTGSSALSPFGSPKPPTDYELESDSDDYSPVCSDADSSEFDYNDLPYYDEHVEFERQIQNEQHRTDKSSSENPLPDNLKVTLLYEICKLLDSFVKFQPPQLASQEVIYLLLKSALYFPNKFSYREAFADLINKILKCQSYVIPLLRTNIIEHLYDLTEYQHDKLCLKCLENKHFGNKILGCFTYVAESEVSKGEIAHALIRGDDEMKAQLVLVIPYVITDHSLLKQFLLECGGLRVLMNLFQQNDKYTDRSMRTLCSLAKERLEIPNPIDVETCGTTSGPSFHDGLPGKTTLSGRLVAFKLDDGEVVHTERDFLTSKSEFFAILLNGHFKESDEDEVNLHNVKGESLRCLLDLLQHDKLRWAILRRIRLEVLLDTATLADRYLLTDLCMYIIEWIEKKLMMPQTVAAIYRWSIESQLNLLRVESVAFAMVYKYGDNKRVNMLKQLFDLGYIEELAEDIYDLLARYVTMERFKIVKKVIVIPSIELDFEF
ncbi:uncharacterized protein [Leptinotarsa decemlineata]|uniref:uncharacterized protein n=1 Tax=Leptinotarsa decemlineata TaxID=7539 RepID=UPI003D308010